MRTYTTRTLAQWLHLAEQSVRRMRHEARGPKYIRLGGPRSRVLYREEDVEAWLAEREAGSTSEESARAQVAAAAGE